MKSVFLKSFLFLLITLCFSFNVYASSQTPEQVCAGFVRALFSSDMKALQKIILPNKNAFLLWDDVFADDTHEINGVLSDLKYYSLSVGDTIALDEETDFVVRDDMIAADKAVVLVTLDGEPLSLPFFLYLRKGVWKVDASDIIDSRHIIYLQAVEELRSQEG